VLRRALAATLLVAAGCSGSGEPPLSPPVAATTPAPGHTDRTVRARVEMRARGAESFDVRKRMLLRVVEISGGRHPQGTWFFSVSTAPPFPTVSDGRQLVFDADLAPGIYQGPGKTYALDPSTKVSVSGIASPLRSAAYVQLVRTTPKVEASRFDRIDRPCAFVVGRAARTGRVDCPRLLDEKGRAVSLQWEWELV
jgi:hypothetical protein